ncbi:MAG: hypothetical protein II295_09865 [Akkermansia sp.]|nr:hypothetical protein [Akkermansia sp.]
MKFRNALLAAALVMPAMAGTETIIETPVVEPVQKKLSGLISLGIDTNYTGRGYVISHTVAEGDGSANAALKLNYDLGEPGKWTLGSTIAYISPLSGHKLYGEPTLGGNNIVAVHPEYGPLTGAQAGAMGQTIGYKNIENQFTVITEAKYTEEKWNVAFGHNFTHGGLLGVMTKHFRKRSFSNVNEAFVQPEWTPYKWLSIGMKTSYSFQGMEGGWWFEPYATVKAPIIGTPEDLTLLGTVTVGMSASYDYFKDTDHACANGPQAFFVKVSTPWFVNKNFIITPSVSFNWLGKGGLKANGHSQAAYATGYEGHVPFRNFGVVAGISATYTF